MNYEAGPHMYSLEEGWGDLPDGYQFHRVAGVATDAKDNVFLFNRSPQKMLIFDANGKFKTAWDFFFKIPHGICIDSAGNIYTVDMGTHLVEKHAPWGGLLMTLGNPDQPSDTGHLDHVGGERFLAERASGPFNMCCAVAVSDSGEIFVADGYGNSRVHKFSPQGELLMSWGEPGKGGPGEFHLPHGITIDRHGRLLVCDRENNRIQIYDQDGNYLDMWTGFLQPTSIAQAPDGLLFVPELGHRVTVLDPDGAVLSRWGGRVV